MTAVVRRRWKHGHQRLSPRRIDETPWLRCLATRDAAAAQQRRQNATIGEVTTVRRQPLPSKKIRACGVEDLGMNGAGRSTMQWRWLRRQYHLCDGLQKRHAPKTAMSLRSATFDVNQGSDGRRRHLTVRIGIRRSSAAVISSLYS